MPLYKIFALPVPNGFTDFFPAEINDKNVAVGTAINWGGPTKALLWQSGAFTLLNIPGKNISARGLNSKSNVVGQVDNQPFFWQKSTGVTSILKDLNGNPGVEFYATAINDKDQITGCFGRYPNQHPVLWQSPNAVPIDLFAGVNLYSPTVGAGADINKNGVVAGTVVASPFMLEQGFMDDVNLNLNLFMNPGSVGQAILDPNYNWNPSFCSANAINNLKNPQVVGDILRNAPPNARVGVPYLFDSQTGLTQDLASPLEPGGSSDLNDSGDVVGNIITGSGFGSFDPIAVLWTFNGLVRTDLNHPTVSDAQINDWHLLSGESINNKGFIVGFGYLNGDTSRALPWLLRPAIQVTKIPLEYMFPQMLWPGQAYDGPRPKGWPFGIPFPIPSPNPFQIVGRGLKHLDNMLTSKKVLELANGLKNEKSRSGIRAIALGVIEEEMKILKKLAAPPTQVKKIKGSSGKRN